MPREREPIVYIMASGFHGTLYTGVTSAPLARIHQHREEAFDGFTAAYGCKRLVWFERHETMDSAIQREKRIKRWRREWKYALIEAENPTWRDLAEDFRFPALPGPHGASITIPRAPTSSSRTPTPSSRT